MNEETQPKAATPNNNPQPAEPTHAPGPGGLAIAAMVVGIVAVLSGWAIFFGLIAGIVAIVLAVLAMKKKQNKAMWVTGLVTGIVAAIWNVIVIIFWAFWLIALVGFGAAAGQVANDYQKSVENLRQESEDRINAKKDFAKGETADFGDFKVKVNSVDKNFTPSENWARADDGKKFISVNVTISTESDETPQISPMTFNVVDGSSIVNASLYDGKNPLDRVALAAGGSMTGDIVFEVSESSTSWKLQYKKYVIDYSAGGTATLTYTLAF